MKKRIFLAVAAVLLMCLTVIAGYQERTFLGARVMPAAQGEELWAQEGTQRLPLNLLEEELRGETAALQALRAQWNAAEGLDAQREKQRGQQRQAHADDAALADLQTRLKTFSGWTAQIIQHEVDHCNGVLI